MAITNISQDGYYDQNGNWVSGKKPPVVEAFDPNNYSRENAGGAAAAYAQQKGHSGVKQVMQEGTVTYQNGVPGIMVKYQDKNGLSTTEWTPLTDKDGNPYSGSALGANGGRNAGGPVDLGLGGGGGIQNSNPYFNQLQSLYQAQGAGEAASMRDSIRQMLIAMGVVPEGFKDKFGAIDDTTLALIKKNNDTGIASKARLDEQKLMGIKGLINRLNARGLRRSGARGAGLRKNQLDYDRNYSDMLSQLMQQVGGMYSQYSSNEYARQAALINAAMSYFSGSTGSTTGPGGGGGDGGGGSSPAPIYSQVADPGTFGSSQTDPAYNMGGGWWAM